MSYFGVHGLEVEVIHVLSHSDNSGLFFECRVLFVVCVDENAALLTLFQKPRAEVVDRA